MKGEMMTHKQIAKMIKSKGLQKTRWYCQMCQKQCRDANGFKCHLSSESHQRNMSLYASNKGRITDEFSKEFDAGMMDIIRRKYKTQRVHANVVYNEYIRDREHTHMNATRWITLTNYVMYLGKTGKCKVEETPKGWYLLYNETDPEILRKQARLERKEQIEKEAEARQLAEMERRYQAGSKSEYKPTELIRDSDSGKITFSLFSKKNTENSAESSKQETQFQYEGNPDEYVHYEGELDVDEMDLPYEFENDEFEQYEMDDGAEDETQQQDNATTENENTMDANGTSKIEPMIAAKDTAPQVVAKEQLPDEKPSATPPLKEKPTEVKQKPLEKTLEVPNVIPKDKSEQSKPKEEEKSKPKPQPASVIGSQWDRDVTTDYKKKEQDKKRKVSALEELMMQEEQKKEKINRKDYWLAPGIVVKVINKKLADGKYYKQKGYIKQVIDKYVGTVKMLEGGDILKLDQEHLETVIPNIGGQIKVVNGAYRGAEGTLLSIDTSKFSASVKLLTGPHTGRTIQAAYEDISKMYSEM